MGAQVSDRHRRQRGRNWALLGVLAALVVLFYLLTIVRFGSTLS
jgi:hypothetical protein